MPTIIKKGTNASCFRLQNGKVVMLEPDVLKVLNKDEYDMLMSEYGSFIKPRIITDAKPNGCFIVNDKTASASAQDKEVGEVKDKSSRIEVKEVKRGGKKKKA